MASPNYCMTEQQKVISWSSRRHFLPLLPGVEAADGSDCHLFASDAATDLKILFIYSLISDQDWSSHSDAGHTNHKGESPNFYPHIFAQ